MPISVSGDASARYRICNDSNCTSAGSFTASAGSVSPNQYVQLQLTASASTSTSVSATLGVGGGSASWTVTTTASGTNLVPGNTTLTASRDGFVVRCNGWSGQICTKPQINPNASAWLSSTAAQGSMSYDQWFALWWGDQTKISQMFCYLATGNATATNIGTNSLNTLTVSMLAYDCQGTGYNPCRYGTYTLPVSPSWSTRISAMINNSTTSSMQMQCSW